MRAEFIKRYLNKTPDDVGWADLYTFISEGIEENLTLEYKPRGMLVDDSGTPRKQNNRNEVSGFSQLAKLVAVFANSCGGLLVLGVKEKTEKHRGITVKIRPGKFSEIPPTVTREMIEHNLEAKIQFPIDDLTIIPLRRSLRAKNCIYLIDVPQSDRAPHRVNDIYYYQRHNFSTVEMQHYQISDMFGRRMRPNLDIVVNDVKNNITTQKNGERTQLVTIDMKIINSGRATAKYVTCLCSLLGGGNTLSGLGGGWVQGVGGNAQFETKQDHVIHPDLPLHTGRLAIFNALKPDETGNNPVILHIRMYAEDMPGKVKILSIDPISKSITDLIANKMIGENGDGFI